MHPYCTDKPQTGIFSKDYASVSILYNVRRVAQFVGSVAGSIGEGFAIEEEGGHVPDDPLSVEEGGGGVPLGQTTLSETRNQ